MCSELNEPPPAPHTESDHANQHDRTLSLLDVVVFAPLGAVLKATAALPDLVEAGREEYRKRAPGARFLGKMVVEQQRRKRRQRTTVKVAVPEPGPSDEVTPSRRDPATPVAGSNLRPSLKEPSASAPDSGVVSSADLPIEGYDTLAARSILGLLEGLSSQELEKVAAYEKAHRQRATILHRIDQLTR